MAPPGGEISFVFHTNNAKFTSLSHAKKKVFGYLSYPRSGAF